MGKIKTPPPSADVIAQERRIAQNLRKLAIAGKGVRLHVWSTGSGFQGNVSFAGENAWTVSSKRSAYDAIDDVLAQRVKALG